MQNAAVAELVASSKLVGEAHAACGVPAVRQRLMHFSRSRRLVDAHVSKV